MKRHPAIRLALTLALCALVTACGFRLVGTRPLPAPLQSVYIDVVASYRVSEPPVETYLRNLLLRRGGRVESKPGEGITILRLSDLRETRTVLSLGPDGKAIEYQLTTRVSYQAMQGDKMLLPPDVLSASRDYSFNAQQVLAKEAEEARLRDFIQADLAELLLLRLETSLAASTSGELPQ